MKKILKKISVEVLKYILITVVLLSFIIGGYNLSGMNSMKTYKFTLDNSEVGAESFFPFNDLYYYEYRFYVSDDPDCSSEIRIFEQVNKTIGAVFHQQNRYKNYLTASTDKAIGTLYLQLNGSAEGVSDEKNTALIYYSNNKAGIETVKYSIKNLDTETVEEKTVDTTRHQPLMLLIPCTYNHGNYRYEVLEASFYDIDGNLVFEDNRKNT